MDGAIELCEGADVLKTRRTDSIVLRDFKHYAANVLKKIVGGDDRFADVLSHIGRTRSAIQQTELAHLTPPGKKPKARFMNLAATLKWATMVLWHLSHPYSNARRELTTSRINEKLGWLRKYRDDIEHWLACQSVVSVSLTFINEQAVFRGATDALAAKRQRRLYLIHEINLINNLFPPGKSITSGQGHPATWRTLLIKVATEVVERARCIRIKLPSNWPWLVHHQAVSKASMALDSLQIE